MVAGTSTIRTSTGWPTFVPGNGASRAEHVVQRLGELEPRLRDGTVTATGNAEISEPPEGRSTDPPPR